MRLCLNQPRDKPMWPSIHVLCGVERDGWISPGLAIGLVQLASQLGDIILGVLPVSGLRPASFARNHSCESALGLLVS